MKIALITGATGSVGEALASLLHREGYALIVTGRKGQKLKQLAKTTGAEPIICDLAKDRAPLLALLRERKPDLVINNAGFGLYGEAALNSFEAQSEIIEVNAVAVTEITLAAIKLWREEKRSGVVLNVSSVAGEVVAPWMALYAAAKAFVTHLSQSLDYENSPYGIRVLVHLPGQIATNFASYAAKKRVARTAWMLDPEKVARAIYKQIQAKKRIKIYDVRYRLLLFFTKCLPANLIARSVQSSLKRRMH